jgi:hypothetical protein
MIMWPKGLWAAMIDVQNRFSTPENPISLKEVETTFIRQMLIERFGFKCDHPVQYVKKNEKGTIYCKWCWTFLIEEEAPKEKRFVNDVTVIPGKYKRKKSFLDQKVEQDKEEGRILSNNPMSSI